MSEPGHEEHFIAAVEDAGLRLDVFLARRLPALSRSQIQRLIRSGRVTTGHHPPKTSTPVTPGLAVHVVVPAPEPDQFVVSLRIRMGFTPMIIFL